MLKKISANAANDKTEKEKKKSIPFFLTHKNKALTDNQSLKPRQKKVT